MKSLIFDMDGTLFQTDKILEISLEDTFEYLRQTNRWDKETPIDKYREIMGVTLPVVWETLLLNHSEEIRHESNELFHQKLIYHIEHGHGALYPYVEDMFQQLKENGYDLYIASNGLANYLQAIVAYYRLDKWITETCSIEQIDSQHKTDLVRTIMEKYAIQSGAVIGDRLSDICAAKDNGLVAIGCRFEFAQEAELAQADYVINSFSELEQVIEIVNNRAIQVK